VEVNNIQWKSATLYKAGAYEVVKVPAEAIIHGCNFAGCAGYSLRPK